MSGEPDPAAWLRTQVEARHELALLATANRDPRGYGKRLGGEWETGCTCKGECPGYPRCEEVTGDGIHIYAEGGHDADQATLIAANDPQDTIARCEAELAILDEHRPTDYLCYGDRLCRRCQWGDDEPERDELHHGVVYPCRTVRLLGSGYRARPGYREEWKP